MDVQQNKLSVNKAKLIIHVTLLSAFTLLFIATLAVNYTVANTSSPYYNYNNNNNNNNNINNNNDDGGDDDDARGSLSYVSAKYYLEVTPPSYVFATIWIIIYLWVGVGVTLLWVLLIIECSGCSKLFSDLIQANYLISLIINLSANTMWVIVFRHERIIISFCILIIICLSLYVALGHLSKVIEDSRSSTVLVWSARIILQNGISVYAAWTSLVTLLNLAMILTYKPSPDSNTPYNAGMVEQSGASNIMLAHLLAGVLVWFMAEQFILAGYCDYTLAAYPKVLFALAGILSNRQQLAAYNFSVAIIILIITVFILCIRAALVIGEVRSYKKKPGSPYSRRPGKISFKMKYNKKDRTAIIGERTPVISK